MVVLGFDNNISAEYPQVRVVIAVDLGTILGFPKWIMDSVGTTDTITCSCLLYTSDAADE